MAQTTSREVLQVRGDGSRRTMDALVAEAPMELRLAGVPLAVIMRTPGHDAELALGFALTEGIVLGPEEVADVRPVPGDDEGNRWELVLAPGVVVDPDQFRRNLYTSSSCGVCGKASIDAVLIAAPQAAPGPRINRDVLLSLPETMQNNQEAFAATGGMHAAALFDPAGTLLAIREDVGRHNAVDKVVGAVARSRRRGDELVLMVSGRVSFEMVQKAGVARISILCGVSAASSLAVELAEELGMTIIGFLRPDGFNVYTGEYRLR